MSKRSGLSRWEDLRRWFVDVGRYRYILHKFDMEPWLDKTCPICNLGFDKEPTYYYESYPIHNTCSYNNELGESTPEFEAWANKLADEREEDYNPYTYTEEIE